MRELSRKDKEQKSDVRKKREKIIMKKKKSLSITLNDQTNLSSVNLAGSTEKK